MARTGRKTRGSAVGSKGSSLPLDPAPRKRRFFPFAAFVAGMALTAAAFLTANSLRRTADAPSPPPSASISAGATKTCSSLYELLAMTPDDLAHVDIAVTNLLCASGLPGADNLDIALATKKLDEWAAKVKFETERHLYRVDDPRYADHYKHSEARLRAEFIVQCLQEDCGVHYNVARIRDINFSNSKDLFLHGMIGSDNGGTCASMPVMYVAIGRRLGYPMKLVGAKTHLFCRWDGGGERFNIEGASNGNVNYFDDDYYRKWPEPISGAEMATGEFLRSFGSNEELATFLLSRGACLQSNNRLPEALTAFSEAYRLMPAAIVSRASLAVAADQIPVADITVLARQGQATTRPAQERYARPRPGPILPPGIRPRNLRSTWRSPGRAAIIRESWRPDHKEHQFSVSGTGLRPCNFVGSGSDLHARAGTMASAGSAPRRSECRATEAG